MCFLYSAYVCYYILYVFVHKNILTNLPFATLKKETLKKCSLKFIGFSIRYFEYR